MLITSEHPLKKSFQGYHFDTARCDVVFREDSSVFLFKGWLYDDLGKTPRDLFEALHRTDDLSQFHGVFCGALIRDGELTIFNDRLGLGDIFVQEDPLVVADRFTEFFRVADYERSDLDPVAVAEFTMFEHCLAGRTFLKSVRLHPLATVRTFGRGSGRQYWQYEFTPRQRSRPEAFEELDHLFNNAVRRIRAQHPDGVFGLGLSGGLDSRISAQYLLDQGADIRAFVFDHKCSDAARVSSRLARVMNIPLQRLELPDDFSPVIDAHMDYDPMYSIRQAAYCTARDQLPECDAMVTGFFGDTGFGSHIKSAELQPEGSFVDKMRKRLNVVKVQLVDDQLLHEIGSDIEAYDDGREHWRSCERCEIDNRQRRFVKNSPSFHFYGMWEPTYSMFSDSDVVNFILSLGPTDLYENAFYHDFIRHRFPVLSGIRSERRAYTLQDSLQKRRFMTLLLKVKYKILEKTGVALPFYPGIRYRDAFDFQHIYDVNRRHVEHEVEVPGLRMDVLRGLGGLRGNQVQFNHYTVGLFARRYLDDAS